MTTNHGPRDEPVPMRLQGFQPVPPTLGPASISAFKRALAENNDRDHWAASVELPPGAWGTREVWWEPNADDLAPARGVLMPIAIFLALGLGVVIGCFVGRYVHWR